MTHNLVFVRASYNKPVGAHCIPQLVLIAILLASATSCNRKSTTVSQTPQATPSPSASATRSSIPQRIGLVNDFAKAFNPSQEKSIESALTQLKTDADVEFVVVTIESTNGQPLFDYSLALARDWAPGGDSGRGLVLILAIDDREWRLQVSRALEKELPDDVCLSLAEPAEALYKQGKYAEGVETYVKAIGDRLKAGK